MQDQDIPPLVEENTDGVAEGVRQKEVVVVARWAAIVRSSREFSQLRWIIAIAPIWAGTMATAAEDRAGPAFRRPIP